jgi:hypothetical protein
MKWKIDRLGDFIIIALCPLRVFLVFSTVILKVYVDRIMKKDGKLNT